MSTVTCPKCVRQVSLPLGDDRSVWVRCPLCSGQYSLQEAIDFVPPMLLIVTAPNLGSGEPATQLEHAAAETVFAARPIELGTATGHGETVHFDAAAHPEDSEGGELFDDASVGEKPADGEANGRLMAEHLADPFEAAMSDQELTHDQDEEMPFVADDDPAFEHAEGEHAPDGDEEFRFADEHDGESAELHEAGGMGNDPHEGDSHSMGAIATMAAKPPKKKRKVPLTVRLIGIGIFFGVGLLGCLVVYSAFLYFGISDLFGVKDYFPKWMVAESLKNPQTPGRGPKPSGDPKPLVNNQNTPGPDSKQPNPEGTGTSTTTTAPMSDGDKPGEKPVVADNGTPPAANPDNKGPAKPGPADVATNPPAKPDPATNPFDYPKPNGDPSKDDPSKLDPLGGAAKLPNLDVPDVKVGKTPAKSPDGTKPPGDAATEKPNDKPMTDAPATDKPTTDKPATDKPAPDVPAPAKSPAGDPLEKPIEPPPEKPIVKPIEKPTETIAPKSDVTYSVADLATAMQAAEQSNANLATAIQSTDEKKLKAARIANFLAMSHLATVLTFAKSADAKDADQLGVLKSQIESTLAAPTAVAAQAERDVVGGYARVGIDSPKRKESGLFAAGTLKKTEARGRLFESEVDLPGGAAVTVVTPRKPAVAEGGAVLLLGAVVNEPAKNLPGYEGQSEKIIFGDVLVAPAKDGAATPAKESKKPGDDVPKSAAGDSGK